ncbi:hypothetical protein [Paenibacillus methanolicus]|uniref:Uncharacterized protein n=1 Tax=Paenibacillus methanolicus TaxID=582686 RepID=A0A5S5CFE7_9BACL|nr:hypothetical protein [Paenibacillus methanolicus]TYP78131.1 hypothetical protein BCM02_102708 [Paenibacillus methanolicus]
MTALGVWTIASMGLILLAGLDMLVYGESFYKACWHLLFDYTHVPAFVMIGAALLLAGWGDAGAAVLRRLRALRIREERK